MENTEEKKLLIRKERERKLDRGMVVAGKRGRKGMKEGEYGERRE